jgi:protein gp37
LTPISYARTLDVRFEGGRHWGKAAPRKFFGKAHWRRPHGWNRNAEEAGERHRVFVSSMCDWAEIHERAEINDQMEAERARLFRLIDECTSLDFLMLTKRAANLETMLPWYRGEPPANVWLGVTAEDQKRADERIPLLLAAPAAIRFLSCEPLLGPLDLRAYLDRIDWVILGNEDAPRPRETEMEWVRSLLSQCAEAGVPVHAKQWYLSGDAPDGIAGRPDGRKIHLPVIDGRVYDDYPRVLA